jgi:4-aminobutyrate aminotransferase
MRKKSYPQIITSLPGPKAGKLIKKDDKFVSKSHTKEYPLVVKRARGAIVEDVDGNKFLDFTSGVAVCGTGHCHPEVVRVIRKQAKELLHMTGADFYNPLQIQLAEKLSNISPYPRPKRIFFGNSGTEAVEAAFKLSRYHMKRHMVIAFLNSFHGRSMGSLSLTSSKVTQRRRFYPLIPGVIHVPYAYCYRCFYGLKRENCDLYCVKWIKDDLFKTLVSPEEIAAIFVEPIQGEGGYIVPPREFHEEIYKLAKEFGFLYVSDEVQTGMGRTGKMFASTHFGVKPDIITLSKGIASGMPLSATIAHEKIMDWGRGTHASTFGGNPVSCAAALKTIQLLEDGLIKNAARMGKYMIRKLSELQNAYEIIGDVRGLGLMIGIELVKNRETKERAVKERDKLIQENFKRGLLLLECGRSAIRFIPALNINKAQIDTALTIFEETLAELKKKKL